MGLEPYIKILLRRKFIVILTIVVTLIVVGVGTALMTPVYQASTTIRIAAAASGQLSYTDYTYSQHLMNTYVEIVTSGPVLTTLNQRLGLAKTPDIKAEIVPNTELIKITVNDTNPQIAMDAANTLADILIEQSAQQYTGGKKSSQELVTEQLAQAKTDLDQAQSAYNTLLSQTLPNSQKLEAAKETFQQKQSQYTEINQQYVQAILANADPTKKLALSKQLDQAKSELDMAASTQNALQVESLSNSQQLDAAKQLLDLKQNIYATLSSQYTQAILRGEFQANMMTVIEAANLPKQPYRPQVALNYVLGLVAGLVAGLGLAFIIENLDTTLYSTDEIEAITKRTALANIPFASKKQLDISLDSATALSESFRNLASMLQFFCSRLPHKVLLIMSAEPIQGKSMITYNLALSLAEFGERIVVVDCDLHLPNMHTLFGVSNEAGLLDVLSGKIDLKEALQTSSHPEITVLSSGHISMRSFQLLGSSEMTALVETLRNQFDYVLLDSPALLAVADASVLAKNADALIEVVRLAHARRESIQKSSRFLAGYPDKFLALVINQTENKHSYKYYHKTTEVDRQSIKPIDGERILPVNSEETKQVSSK